MANNIFDIHLLIPLQIQVSRQTSSSYVDSCILGNHFVEQLDICNRTEFSNPYVRNLLRHPLGDGSVTVTNHDGEKVDADCFATISIHEPTRLAVIDVVLSNLKNDAERFVDFFRSKLLKVDFGNGPMSLDQWLFSMGLFQIGDHRTIVFSKDNLDLETRIKFLVSECEPMGKLIGEDFIQKANNNIAQYDIAQAYVSDTTLLEISSDFKVEIKDRLSVQAIEVFFVELLLLQDAAICRINKSIDDLMEKERTFSGNSSYDLISIVTDLSKVTKFFDPRNFLYPTVRASFVRIADSFGIPRQLELMNENKAVLEQLISLNSSKVQSKENDIINVILVILAAIQVVPLFIGDHRTLFYTGLTSTAFLIFIILLKRRLHKK